MELLLRHLRAGGAFVVSVFPQNNPTDATAEGSIGGRVAPWWSETAPHSSSLRSTFALVAALVSIPELQGLVDPGGGSAGHGGPEQT